MRKLIYSSEAGADMFQIFIINIFLMKIDRTDRYNLNSKIYYETLTF